MRKNNNMNLTKIIVLFLVITLFMTGCANSTLVDESAGESEKHNESSYVVPDQLNNLPVEWDPSVIYKDRDEFYADMARAEELIPSFEKLKGHFATVDGILEYVSNPDYLEYWTLIEKASAYCGLLEALDHSDPFAAEARAKCSSVKQSKKETTAFMDEELYALTIEERRALFADERLAKYANSFSAYTEQTEKEYSSEGRDLIDQFEDVIWSSYDIFNTFAYVDMPWPKFTYPDGREEELSVDLVNSIIADPSYSQEFREDILLQRCSVYDSYSNTYAALLESYIQSNCTLAEVYGYDNYLLMELEDTGVKPELYQNVIAFGRSIIPEMERYNQLRQKQQGFDRFTVSDVYLAASDYVPKEISYDEAVNLGREALKILGNDYMEKFDAIVTNGHVDVYPKENKESGAFESSHGLVSDPYVLLNFDGKETYIRTIVHEMGHACYDAFTNESQEYFNQDPPLFTQEIASTVNELLFFNYMINSADSEDEKLYWLEQTIINLFNGMILRQCLYSEFEDWCYKTIESGGYLTAEDMNEKYVSLYREYYPGVEVPDEFGPDWIRLEHFYYDYYVYQYATSTIYAGAIVNRINKIGPDAIEDYKAFLSAGSSKPIDELLKIAGIDPYDQTSYDFAYDQMKQLIDTYESFVTGN